MKHILLSGEMGRAHLPQQVVGYGTRSWRFSLNPVRSTCPYYARESIQVDRFCDQAREARRGKSSARHDHATPPVEVEGLAAPKYCVIVSSGLCLEMCILAGGAEVSVGPPKGKIG